MTLRVLRSHLPHLLLLFLLCAVAVIYYLPQHAAAKTAAGDDAEPRDSVHLNKHIALNMKRATISPAGTQSGKVRIRGTMDIDTPPSIHGGVVVWIRDAGTFAEETIFTDDECAQSTSGRIDCRRRPSASGKSHYPYDLDKRGAPLRAIPFALPSRRSPCPRPFLPPLKVFVHAGGTTIAGQNGHCFRNHQGLRCRQR